MQDDPVSGGLTGALAAWSGHHSALASRLARPNVARLTEEQEALAMGVARRLVLALAGSLPLLTPSEELWDCWENAGIPAAGGLAPLLMARVEEYRWRRMVGSHAAEAAMPMFSDLVPAAPIAAVIDDPQEDIGPTSDAAEAAYLSLRIADGARRDGFAMPLLPPAELPEAVRRALLLDLAAQDLALAGDSGERARQLAQAIDAHKPDSAAPSIDAAAHAYHEALAAAGMVGPACNAAIVRGDWLAVLALLATAHRCRFSDAAAALLAADDAAIVAALGPLGLDARDAGPLLDALAEVPARPIPRRLPQLAAPGNDTASVVAARANSLKGGQS